MAKRLLFLFIPLLILTIAGAAVTIWIKFHTEGRSGKITGPVILAQIEEALEECIQAKDLALAEAQGILDGEKIQPQEAEEIEMPKESQEPETEQTSDREMEEVEDPDTNIAPKLRIVLDPGHGGPGTDDEQELGAIYRDTYEKYLTLEIAKAMEEELSKYGNVEVFLTRDSDRSLTLKERASYAKSVNGDLLVSLHLNASAEHNFYGSEVFVSAFDRFYARGAGVGGSILNQLTDYGFVSKGVKTRLGSKGADYYGIIRECKSLEIPALIVEHGYMDEDSDWSLMCTTEALRSLGQRDAAGLAAYFGLEKGNTLSELPELDEFIPSTTVLPDTTPPEEVWYKKEFQGNAQWLITLHGTDQESQVMYYDYSLNGGQTYSELKLWDEGETIQFTMMLTGEEDLIFRVYNNYELRTETD
jgi:N-acetylmuramoyl-L-alanine amidase